MTNLLNVNLRDDGNIVHCSDCGETLFTYPPQNPLSLYNERIGDHIREKHTAYLRLVPTPATMVAESSATAPPPADEKKADDGAAVVPEVGKGVAVEETPKKGAPTPQKKPTGKQP